VRYFFVATVLLAACDPVWSLRVAVRSPDGAKLEKAALVLTRCEQQEEHDLGTVAALTDANGEALVGGLGDTLPESCEITVAKPGFKPYQSSFRKLCGGDTDHCDRSQHLDVELLPTGSDVPVLP